MKIDFQTLRARTSESLIVRKYNVSAVLTDQSIFRSIHGMKLPAHNAIRTPNCFLCHFGNAQAVWQRSGGVVVAPSMGTIKSQRGA